MPASSTRRGWRRSRPPGALALEAEPAVTFYVECCGEEEAARRLVADLVERIESGHSEIGRSRDLIEALDVVESGRVVPAGA